MAECIIYFSILFLVACIMFAIGISQLKSREPVGFYTGVKAPEKNKLRDVRAWNRKHGIMWILYGGSILLCGLVSLVAGVLECDSVFLIIMECAVWVAGIFVMAWYHGRLEKRYRL